MTRQNAEQARDIEHLTGFDCLRCGHAAVAHYRSPSCRNCRCSADPVCWCGVLASKHVTPSAPTHAEESCTCGSDATSLNPAEVVVHRHNGEPCYIAPTHADEGGA